MAKKRNYNAHSHYGLNIFCFFMALIMITACILCGLELWGTGKQKPSQWFKKDEETKTNEATATSKPVLDGDGNELSENTVNPMPASMIFTAPTAALQAASDGTLNTVTIKAEVSPKEVSDKTVNFSIRFVNPTSEWASGKVVTDYVSLSEPSPTENGSEVTVSYHKAFGERIYITASTVATDVNGLTLSKTCTVECRQTIEDIPVLTIGRKQGINSTTELSTALYLLQKDERNELNGEIKVDYTTSSDYTIAIPEEENQGVKVKLFTTGSETIKQRFISSSKISAKFNDITAENVIGNTYHFDYRIFEEAGFTYSEDNGDTWKPYIDYYEDELQIPGREKKLNAALIIEHWKQTVEYVNGSEGIHKLQLFRLSVNNTCFGREENYYWVDIMVTKFDLSMPAEELTLSPSTVTF